MEYLHLTYKTLLTFSWLYGKISQIFDISDKVATLLTFEQF